MTTSQFPTNQTATIVNSAIDGVFKVGVTLAETAIFAEVPILAEPILDVLTKEAVQLIANEIYKQFAMFVTFEIIDFQVSGEVSDSKKALAALKAAQAGGDRNAIDAALKVFTAATVALTHIDGSANPGSL